MPCFLSAQAVDSSSCLLLREVGELAATAVCWVTVLPRAFAVAPPLSRTGVTVASSRSRLEVSLLLLPLVADLLLPFATLKTCFFFLGDK